MLLRIEKEVETIELNCFIVSCSHSQKMKYSEWSQYFVFKVLSVQERDVIYIMKHKSQSIASKSRVLLNDKVIQSLGVNHITEIRDASRIDADIKIQQAQISLLYCLRCHGSLWMRWWDHQTWTQHRMQQKFVAELKEIINTNHSAKIFKLVMDIIVSHKINTKYATKKELRLKSKGRLRIGLLAKQDRATRDRASKFHNIHYLLRNIPALTFWLNFMVSWFYLLSRVGKTACAPQHSSVSTSIKNTMTKFDACEVAKAELSSASGAL